MIRISQWRESHWEFDSRKDLHSKKFPQRPHIIVMLSHRELCDSKLSALHPLDNMA